METEIEDEKMKPEPIVVRGLTDEQITTVIRLHTLHLLNVSTMILAA